MLFLYDGDTSVCCQKVRIVMAEKDLDYDYTMVDVHGGQNFSPEYKKINPKALVPALVHDGRILLESNLICTYLDEVWPQPGLMPRDPYERHLARMWMKRVDEEVHPATGPLTYAIATRRMLIERYGDRLDDYTNEIPDPARRERRRAALRDGVEAPLVRDCIAFFDRLCGDMDAQLRESRFLVGDGFTLADVALVPYVTRLDWLGLSWYWSERPRLAAWYERVRSRPSYDTITRHLSAENARRYRESGERDSPRVKQILEETRAT